MIGVIFIPFYCRSKSFKNKIICSRLSKKPRTYSLLSLSYSSSQSVSFSEDIYYSGINLDYGSVLK